MTIEKVTLKEVLLKKQVAELQELLERTVPILEKSICYASLASEHEPNAVHRDVVAALYRG